MIHLRVLRRARVVSMIVACAIVLLLIRILWIQTVQYDTYQAKVIEQMTTESTVRADRGSIYDTNGILIATNITTYRIFIAPRTIAEEQAEAQEDGKDTDFGALITQGLSTLLGEGYGITEDFVRKQLEYTYYLDRTIARQVDEETADRVLAFIDDNELERMVYLEATGTRYYPYGSLAAHLLGFTGSDGTGLYGLEYSYDTQLSGTPGKYIVARDAQGHEMPYEYEEYIEAVDGYNLTTTVDVFVQSALEEQLKIAYEESGAQHRACGIVMDPNTGAVLAMATYPTFDLNDPWTLNAYDSAKLAASGLAQGSEEYAKLKSELLLSGWSNKALTEAYIPGSTFKIITAAMALEQGVVKTTDQFNCSGVYTVNGIKIHCHKLIGHGALNFCGGIQQSCNPVLMAVGLKVGQQTFYDYFRAFGYLGKTGIDLSGEGKSVFHDPAKFAVLDLATASFGQNFKITPIQHMRALCAVANGGYLVTPHVVQTITDNSGNIIESTTTSQSRQVVSTEVCDTISKILEEGVSVAGGARNAYVAGYRIAAKTGTSEKIGDSDRDDAYICSCVAYAPAESPAVCALIMVDEPTKGTLYGSVVAAPYVAKLMETILPHLGIEAVYSEAELAKLAVTVPNLRYYSLNQAQKSAERAGLTLKIVGDGEYVMSQNPTGGTKIEKENGVIVVYTGDAVAENTLSVPDVIGMSALSANRHLINNGLNIRIEGTQSYTSAAGAVAVSQSPAAGEMVAPGTVVTVSFRYLNETD
jgi:stage V sporulation protein D (sporulation-specific penicillin-binding protein)